MPENGNGALGGTMVAMAAGAGQQGLALGVPATVGLGPAAAPSSPSLALPPASTHHQQHQQEYGQRLAPSPLFREVTATTLRSSIPPFTGAWKVYIGRRNHPVPPPLAPRPNSPSAASARSRIANDCGAYQQQQQQQHRSAAAVSTAAAAGRPSSPSATVTPSCPHDDSEQSPATAAAAAAAERGGADAKRPRLVVGGGEEPGASQPDAAAASASSRGLGALGWRLADDGMVYGPIRQTWYEVIAKLIQEHRLERGKARGFVRMMRFFAQCQAQAKISSASSHVVITDPSAGLTKLVEGFLASTADDEEEGEGDKGDEKEEGKQEGKGDAADKATTASGGASVSGSNSGGDVEGPSELLRLLTSDEGACFLIEDSTSGEHVVRCNERMSRMFISTDELQGMVNETGLAVGHLMMRLMGSEDTVKVLAKEMALMALDRYSKPTIDIPLQCLTRWGESVRCLGTVGVYLNEQGQSILVLRLWPLGDTRNFGVDELKNQLPTAQEEGEEEREVPAWAPGSDSEEAAAAAAAAAAGKASVLPKAQGLCALGAATPLAPTAVPAPVRERKEPSPANTATRRVDEQEEECEASSQQGRTVSPLRAPQAAEEGAAEGAPQQQQEEGEPPAPATTTSTRAGRSAFLQWGPVSTTSTAAAAKRPTPADEEERRIRARVGIAWDEQQPFQPLKLSVPQDTHLYAPIRWEARPGGLEAPVRASPVGGDDGAQGGAAAGGGGGQQEPPPQQQRWQPGIPRREE